MESLSVKTNKSELEQVEELILSNIDTKISDMRAFVDIYKECGLANRKRIAAIVLWQIIGKLDEVEELDDILDQFNSGESTEYIRRWVNQLEYENLYNYDDAIEEIHSEILEKKRAIRKRELL